MAAAATPELNKLEEGVKALENVVQKANTHKDKSSPKPSQVFGVQKGGTTLGSRPFMLTRLFGFMTGHLDADQAKYELDMVKHFRSVAEKSVAWNPSASSKTVPLSWNLLPNEILGDSKCAEFKEAFVAGAVDPVEVGWLRKRIQTKAAVSPAQSWLDSTLGGDMVAPPAFGEIIDLLRNRQALVTAGARVIPLPAQGAIKFPRITSATTAYRQGENQTGTASTLGVGSLTLSPKKVMCLVNVPNELFRYATVAAEAVLRDDIGKSLALKIDLDALEGPGDGNAIKGLITYSGLASHTASKTDSNGDTLQPQDGFLMAGKVEENNAEMKGWIMRPLMWAKMAGFRGDAVAAGDKAGPFVQAMMRLLGDSPGSSWCGFPVTTSAQVSRSRVKGSGTALTYVLGGDWNDFLIGMFGGIEFLAANQTTEAVANDLTVIRGIMLADAGPRHEGAFVKCDQLLYAS